MSLSKVLGALGKFGHVEKADDQIKNISQTLNPKCKPAMDITPILLSTQVCWTQLICGKD